MLRINSLLVAIKVTLIDSIGHCRVNQR